MYLTEKEINKALNLGWKVTQCPDKGASLDKGSLHIWEIKNGWQTAHLSCGYYVEHQIFECLLEAIKRNPNHTKINWNKRKGDL